MAKIKTEHDVLWESRFGDAGVGSITIVGRLLSTPDENFNLLLPERIEILNPGCTMVNYSASYNVKGRITNNIGDLDDWELALKQVEVDRVLSANLLKELFEDSLAGLRDYGISVGNGLLIIDSVKSGFAALNPFRGSLIVDHFLGRILSMASAGCESDIRNFHYMKFGFNLLDPFMPGAEEYVIWRENRKHPHPSGFRNMLNELIRLELIDKILQYPVEKREEALTGSYPDLLKRFSLVDWDGRFLELVSDHVDFDKLEAGILLELAKAASDSARFVAMMRLYNYVKYDEVRDWLLTEISNLEPKKKAVALYHMEVLRSQTPQQSSEDELFP